MRLTFKNEKNITYLEVLQKEIYANNQNINFKKDEIVMILKLF